MNNYAVEHIPRMPEHGYPQSMQRARIAIDYEDLFSRKARLTFRLPMLFDLKNIC
jgi:hypothetical protein